MRPLGEHLRRAARFLLRCQIVEPYVDGGLLYGAICPWEIVPGMPLLEDFHDTLEAIWVWSTAAELLGDEFREAALKAIQYIRGSWRRFINERNLALLYDCSHALLALPKAERAYKLDLGALHSEAAEILASRLPGADPGGREYRDPWWLAACLAWYARAHGKRGLLRVAKDYVDKHLLSSDDPFPDPSSEPEHVGPGGHDFFSSAATRVLALVACLGGEDPATVRRMLLERFAPKVPRGFVRRHADEHAWNASLAAALAAAYRMTGCPRFLEAYKLIVEELEARDADGDAALPRQPGFRARESWVAFFWAFARVMLERDPI